MKEIGRITIHDNLFRIVFDDRLKRSKYSISVKSGKRWVKVFRYYSLSDCLWHMRLIEEGRVDLGSIPRFPVSDMVSND